VQTSDLTGDQLLAVLVAMAHPIRMRILAALAAGRDYVSHLARVLSISRPLLHIHLQRLEAAGLVRGTLELSEDGKAMKYFENTDFSLLLTPSAFVEAVTTLRLTEPELGAIKEK
jgi:DNA-binding transcriptional ArsR family regulator